MTRISFVARAAFACFALIAFPPAELTAQRIPVGPPPPGKTGRGTRVPTVAALPAPTGVTVTGTPASATIVWQSVNGAASYVVTRRLANAPDQQAKVAATETRYTDIGLRPSTAYTYLVDAIYPDGRSSFTQVLFTTPAAVNPSGLQGVQSGPGRVQLSWQLVPDASYYMVYGPGSTFGGVRVAVSGGNATVLSTIRPSIAYQVTGVPNGPQVWNVASYYDPEPLSAAVGVGPHAVSTAGSAYPGVQVTVGPWSGAVAGAGSGRDDAHFRIIATGFRVVHETADDPNSVDGVKDEVYFAFVTGKYDRVTSSHVGADVFRRTHVLGDVYNHQTNRVLAGTATANGGLQTGDVYPFVADPSQRYGKPVSDLSFPIVVWDGRLLPGQDAVLIFPTLWESHANTAPMDAWAQGEMRDMFRTWINPDVQRALTATTFAAVLPQGTGSAAVFGSKGDRPIGLERSGLPRRVIVLTREMVESLMPTYANRVSRNKMELQLVDAAGADLQGSYILYFEVERLP